MLATQELKDSWLEALRSGKYEQGRLTFKTPEGSYCCLGVLCTVMKHSEWIKLGLDNYNLLRDYSTLTQEETDKLCSMNDEPYSTFAQIADYIEAHIDVAEPASTQTP